MPFHLCVAFTFNTLPSLRCDPRGWRVWSISALPSPGAGDGLKRQVLVPGSRGPPVSVAVQFIGGKSCMYWCCVRYLDWAVCMWAFPVSLNCWTGCMREEKIYEENIYVAMLLKREKSCIYWCSVRSLWFMCLGLFNSHFILSQRVIKRKNITCRGVVASVSMLFWRKRKHAHLSRVILIFSCTYACFIVTISC